MKLDNEDDLIRLVEEDTWMMNILQTAMHLQLPDWWICAGFVRSKIWDVLHGFEKRTPLPDIDVIYFDNNNLDEEEEKRLEERLKRMDPAIPWSVKNQARMHVVNNLPAAYTSATDAISKFPETVTALGLSLDRNHKLVLTAPHGIEDVIQMRVRPTAHFLNNEALSTVYEKRMVNKDWKATWALLQIDSIRP